MESNQKIKFTRCTDALWEQYKTGYTPVIPDIKLKSPGEGDLMKGRNPVEYAKSLEAAGAPVISVVTEEEHYGGSLELLSQIANAVSVPLLRKDFIKTREQLIASKEHGASGVLLISSILTDEELYTLIDEAIELGMEPLVETHNQDEIVAVKDLELSFLGINNRNILQWETDDGNVNTTEVLAQLMPANALVLSESSISSLEDVKRAVLAGAHAVLVGTAILQAEHPTEMYQKLRVPRS